MKFISGKNAVFIQIKLTESVSENHLLGLATREVEKLGAHGLGQVLDLLSGDSCGLILADVPHRLHHLDEVFIGRHGHSQVSVIVVPLLSGDGAIVVASHAIEAIEELLQNLLSRLLAIDEVLVLRNVVNGVNIINADGAVVGSVDEVEGLLDHVLSALTEWVSQTTDELLISDVTILVDIVVAHQGLNLDDLGEEAVGGERLCELTLIQLLVAIVIHSSEEDTKGADANTTSLLDLHLELVVDATNLDVKTDAVKL